MIDAYQKANAQNMKIAMLYPAKNGARFVPINPQKDTETD